MNKIKKILRLDIIIYLLLICIFTLLYINKYYDNDLFFDIKTGETILKYGIDFKDHFSFIPNLKYLYHHWLYDLLMYFISTKFGFYGIKLFFIFIFSLFFLVYFYSCSKAINNRIIGIIVAIITMLYSAYSFSTRVQSITHLLFFLEVLYLNKLYETGNKKYLFLIVINSIIVVNIHMPLWLFCFVLYLPCLASACISNIMEKKKIKKKDYLDKPKNYKLVYLLAPIILLTGFVSPYGTIPYTFFFKAMTASSFVTIHIQELALTVLVENKYELVLLLTFIVGLYFRLLKVNLRDLFLFLGLFVFSLLAGRNIIYFLLFAPYIILKSIDIKIKPKFKRKIYINKEIVQVTVIILLIFRLISIINLLDIKHSEYKIKEDYPVEIVDYIKTNLDYKNLRIYNVFGFGSYIEYQDLPVFIDSRAEVYSKEFNGGYDIISDFVDSNKIDTYKNVFRKYNFDYAIVYTDSDLHAYLNKDDDFVEVMSSDRFTLYKVNISQE